ncbi:MAG: flippase-like domain-containing protein [Salinivirgaceae bacterium]|nr:flippase-like domain-containing protein [Salinivirgaceae bacterium]
MKRALGLILRIAVAAASLVFIGWKVHGQLTGGVVGFTVLSVGPMLASVALMPLNWIVEAVKWRVLTSHLQPFSLWQALRSVLAGLAVSMLTPNRVGDFAGRIAFLNPGNRTAGAMSAFVGGYAQMLAIASLGVVAFGLRPVLPDFLSVAAEHYPLSMSVLLAIIIFLTGFYFAARLMAARFKFSRWQWLERFVGAAGRHTNRQLAVALFLSICRSAIFILQLQQMLQSFGVRLELFDAFCSIALMYCFVSVIPTFALAEWGVRGSMALLFIVPLGGQPTQIIAASVALWIINVAVPAAAGAVLGVWRKGEE